jgi:hypothetical protein
MMKNSIVVLIALSLTSCAFHSFALQQAPDKRLLELQKEQDKLKRTTDPVDHAKSDIKISEILISLVSDAARTGDLEMMDKRLGEYTSAIQDAHDTLTKTGRDARKKPHGFKDLEISLRRQINQLKDIGGALTVDDREPVEKARSEATRIRDDLLKALFGSQDATPHAA